MAKPGPFPKISVDHPPVLMFQIVFTRVFRPTQRGTDIYIPSNPFGRANSTVDLFAL